MTQTVFGVKHAVVPVRGSRNQVLSPRQKETAAPTLLMQGIHDTLFPLAQSVANGQRIQTSPDQPPLKLFWFCGGHGDCDIPDKPNEQDAQGVIQNLKWLDQYVSESPLKPADGIPTFQWYDQKGLYYNSDYLPWDARFNQGSYRATGDGGFLGLWPILGGSNRFVIDAGKAWNAVNVEATVPAGKQVVGSPTVSFTYSGLGTGREHTVTIPLEDIAYTSDTGDSLTLQITSSASNYENFWSYGWINIADVQLDMPLHTKVVPTI